ncbi:MAG: KdsC family phosphatase, partial [Acidimicrobiales bacterium]
MSDSMREGNSVVIDAALARRIRLVGLDVDGVLTDGGLYIGMTAQHPVELKRFDIQDGLGIKLLRDAGLAVVLVSARRSEATDLRARELKVDEVVQHNKKLPAFADVLRRRGVAWEDCVFVGDDLPDLPLLRRVGLPIAVANAVPEVAAA